MVSTSSSSGTFPGFFSLPSYDKTNLCYYTENAADCKGKGQKKRVSLIFLLTGFGSSV